MTHNFQLIIIYSFVYNLKSSTLFLIICSVLWLTSNLISPNLLNSQSPSSKSKWCRSGLQGGGDVSRRGAERQRAQRSFKVIFPRLFGHKERKDRKVGKSQLLIAFAAGRFGDLEISRCSTITCTLVGTIAIVHKSQLFTNVTIATNTNRRDLSPSTIDICDL